jgi:hypothetical protein
MSCRKIPITLPMADLNWTLNDFFGYFPYVKESNPRSSAEKIPGFRENA